MRRAGIVLVLTAAVGLAFFALRPLLAGPVAAFGDRIRDVVGGPLWRAGIGVRAAVSGDLEELRARVSSLEGERNRLLAENASLRDLRTENERLRGLLSFADRADLALRAATVVGGSDDPDVHTIEIDAGRAEGALPGDAVVTGDGVVIGKIADARAEASTVELLTDARSRFAATILAADAPEQVGVTEGGHGTGIVLRLIPESARIAAGDPVVTSGLESGIPRGLLIGTVESVSKEPNVPFLTATLSPLAPLAALTAVAVVLSPR